jgi:hypothetical protein
VKKKKSRIVDSFFLLLLASSSTCFSNRYKNAFFLLRWQLVAAFIEWRGHWRNRAEFG